MNKSVLLFTFLVLLSASCGKQEEALTSDGSTVEAAGLTGYWESPNTTFPIDVKIDDDFSSDEKTAISDMGDEWSDALSNEVTFFNMTTPVSLETKASLDGYNDGQMGVYKIESWYTDLPATALAITQIYGEQISNQIRMVHADILVNYDYFDFSTDYSYGYDLQTVMLHEMGHFLGLNHDNTSRDYSVMYPSINRYTINREPKDIDKQRISDKYNLSYSGVSSLVAASQRAPLQRPLKGSGTPVVIRLEMHADGHCEHKIFKDGKWLLLPHSFHQHK